MGDALDELMSGFRAPNPARTGVRMLPQQHPNVAPPAPALGAKPLYGGAGSLLPSTSSRQPHVFGGGAQAPSVAGMPSARARPRSREPGLAAVGVGAPPPAWRPYGVPASTLEHAARPGAVDAAARAPPAAQGRAGATVPAAAEPAPRVPAHGYAAEQNARFRSYMEDDHAVVDAFAGRDDCLFAAVYDGHGGRLAVDFAVSHLHSALAAELRASRHGDVPGCLARAFLRTDRMLLQAGAYHCGSTAACVVFERDGLGRTSLHAANAGDTRIVLLGAAGAPPRCLSVDHLPATNAAEVARVEQAGGRVMNNRVGGSLAVSRALGDHALKGEGGGVTAEPHCVSHPLTAADRFALLATDGVWDVVTLEQAHALVLQHVEAESLADVAKKVVEAAVKGGSRDNISALVLDLRGLA